MLFTSLGSVRMSTQDRRHRFSQYGPPDGRITYIHIFVDLFRSGLPMHAYVRVMYLQQFFE